MHPPASAGRTRANQMSSFPFVHQKKMCPSASAWTHNRALRTFVLRRRRPLGRMPGSSAHSTGLVGGSVLSTTKASPTAVVPRNPRVGLGDGRDARLWQAPTQFRVSHGVRHSVENPSRSPFGSGRCRLGHIAGVCPKSPHPKQIGGARALALGTGPCLWAFPATDARGEAHFSGQVSGSISGKLCASPGPNAASSHSPCCSPTSARCGDTGARHSERFRPILQPRWKRATILLSLWCSWRACRSPRT